MKRQRFSRMEAVAVIALTAIVLSLLLLLTGPRRWRETQYQGVWGECMLSLKLLGSAAALYATDYAGNCPGPVPSVAMPVWDIALGVQSGISCSPAFWAGGTPADKEFAQLFVCHEDEYAWIATRKRLGLGEYDGHVRWGFIQHYDLKIPLHRSYSMNLGNGEIAATADTIPASLIAFPGGTIRLCELHDARNLLGKPDLAAQSGKEFISTIFDGRKAPYHGTLMAPRVFVLCYDGHVELLDEAIARKGEMFRYKKP